MSRRKKCLEKNIYKTKCLENEMATRQDYKNVNFLRYKMPKKWNVYKNI